MKKISFLKFAVVAFLAAGLAPLAHAADLTAFQLIKEGNKYIGEQSKDQVVNIHSDKSVASMTPAVWYIVYYDPDASLKAVEVKFGAGKKMDVSHPFRLLEPITGADKKLDPKKLNTDSDKALKTATGEPLLANLKLKASQMWLERGDDSPVWRIRLWAARLKNPNDDADIGEVIISADDGKVVRNDLHIERVN